jgi:argininosuccinate lyase
VAGLLGVGAAAFMGYNRDTQWSKYLIVDLVAEARDAPAVMSGALRTMYVDRERAAALAAGDFVGSTALMEWLVTAHGLPLRQAKHVVETAVRLSEEAGAATVTAQALHTALATHQVTLDLDAAQVAAVQDPTAIVQAARAAGGPAPMAVDAAIAALGAELDTLAAALDAMQQRITAAQARLRADGAALRNS